MGPPLQIRARLSDDDGFVGKPQVCVVTVMQETREDVVGQVVFVDIAAL